MPRDATHKRDITDTTASNHL